MPRLTDEEILAHYRQANPYISLAVAKKLHRVEQKFGQLGRVKAHRKRQADELVQLSVDEPLHDVPDD